MTIFAFTKRAEGDFRSTLSTGLPGWNIIVALFAICYSNAIAWCDETIPHFKITPERTLVDDQINVSLHRLKPVQRVTVRARMVSSSNAAWTSQTVFLTDASGHVNIARTQPGEKTAPMRILWSMQPEPSEKTVDSSGAKELDPLTVTFAAEADGKEIARAKLELSFIAPDVVRSPLRERGLVGTYFRPKGSGRHPGILILGGSGGGLQEREAALLASRGYSVLALAYFNYETLPKDLVEIPLEYFETALEWLKAQENVRGDKLAVMGRSKGAELALLLGATVPDIKAVIAIVPSHVIWEGFSADPIDSKGRSSWTYKGRPVPYMSAPTDPELLKLVLIADPAVETPLYALRLTNQTDVRQATITVERIQGPVLLISGKDDKLWPSAYMADQAKKRLAEHEHAYPDKHLCYDACGHSTGLPNMPMPPTRVVHPVDKVVVELGGTAEGNAFAAWDSRLRIYQFLEDTLRRD